MTPAGLFVCVRDRRWRRVRRGQVSRGSLTKGPLVGGDSGVWPFGPVTWVGLTASTAQRRCGPPCRRGGGVPGADAGASLFTSRTRRSGP